MRVRELEELSLNACIDEPAFKALANEHLYNVARIVQTAGNRAVHESKSPSKLEAIEVVSALSQFCLFLAFTYGRQLVTLIIEELTARGVGGTCSRLRIPVRRGRPRRP